MEISIDVKQGGALSAEDSKSLKVHAYHFPKTKANALLCIRLSSCGIAIMNRFLIGLAMLGGIGKAPAAGGTLATLAAGIPAAFLLAHLPNGVALAMVLVISVLGTFGAELTIRELGRQDPPEVVVDELAGFLITMLWLPASWISLAAGFALFRLLDIWKPWPIRWADSHVKGGFGAMLDDILAGFMAHLALQLFLRMLK
jgi:phosphatidylglycerophosphatase A